MSELVRRLAYAAGAAAGVLVAHLLLEARAQKKEVRRAQRRVELQERAEQLEAELAGVRVVREQPPQKLQVYPYILGLFGALPTPEA